MDFSFNKSLVIPVIVGTIILAVVYVIGIFAIGWVIKKATEFVWGPENGNGGPGLIPSLTSLALIGGGLALAGILLIPKSKGTKK